METEKATEVDAPDAQSDAVEMESEDLIGPTQSTENIENDTEVDAPTLMSKEIESEDLIGPTQSTENIENEIEINTPMLDAEEIDNAQNTEDKDETNDENTNTTNIPNDKGTTTNEEKMHKFPLGTVKRIMKMEPDVTMASQDAVFLITKAIELFIESLAMESYTYTANQKKKTVSRQDVEKAIDAVDALAFLDGAMDD